MQRQIQDTFRDKLDPSFLLHKVRDWGADIVGIGDVSIGLPTDLTGLSTAISIAVNHPNNCTRNGNPLFYEYRYPEIDLKLEHIQRKIAEFLHENGWRFLTIPPDSSKRQDRLIAKLHPLFPHKTAATCAGLGWVGKSGLLIHPQYGPRLSWATVLTSAPYLITKEPYVKGHCGKCGKCVRACPAGAISGREWNRGSQYQTMVDIAACAQQLERNRVAFGELACGCCIMACRCRT